ncbi:enoyl-CoA hydratase/isomerase family protein [Streptomyces sp. NPDC048483]|uniref:enoyl-CoA hydratase/isomerase family protein n=1 Tax=Streptomyces sp. NPDC048483 TaxID=3154927 RepID=UPI00342C6534
MSTTPAVGATDDSVLLRTEGRAAHIVLNRPRALNALTHDMVRRIDEALTAWESDPAVETVVLTGAGERGLCAGGDIRAIYEDARSGGGSSPAFWADEYRLNARIARYPKPYVAVMDGIVMGGGIGVSAHGNVRLVTERSRLAMPETGIGLAPDVGGTYLLGLAPGELGTHLALTGAQIGAGDALLCGLADHCVPSQDIQSLVDALADTPVREVLGRYAQEAPASELVLWRPWIDACYGADTVEDIVERLLTYGDPAAKETAESLLAKSPTAVKVALAAIRRARTLGPLERVLEQEFRASCAALSSPDLVEGIRAQVVDKDRNPQWSPQTFAEVTQTDVERYFAPPAQGDLHLSASDSASDSAEEVPW